jgi:DNA-binding CsgD family transcriptional regulator/PAS domain-containing protein
MNARRIDDLLLDLYACPPDRGRWPQVLDRICHATRARSAVIQVLVNDGERTLSRFTLRDSLSDAERSEHERYMGDGVNPRMRASLLRPPQRPLCVFRDHDFFVPGDPARKDLEERLAALHLGHFMSAGMPLPGAARLALVLHRDLREQHEFDDDEASFALDLVPHLCQAVQLAERFDEAQQRATDLQSALNHVRCALVLCDSQAHVLWANSAAEQIFARDPRVRISGARLSGTSAHETVMLRRKIASFAQADEHASLPDRYLTLGPNSAGAPLQVMMHPVRAETVGLRASQPRVLLALSSLGELPTLPADLIGRVFALSPAESRIVAALCSGLTINEYASAAGVTIGTARFQLKQVLAKTQANRQADLVRQVCSSVIAHALPASTME